MENETKKHIENTNIENTNNDDEKLLLSDVINLERSCETCIWCASAKMCKTCDEDWSEYERYC